MGQFLFRLLLYIALILDTRCRGDPCGRSLHIGLSGVLISLARRSPLPIVYLSHLRTLHPRSRSITTSGGDHKGRPYIVL